VLIATVGVIAGGMVFQAGGVLGGGDVKLLGAVTAIAGLRFFGEAMFWTLLAGVVVSLVILGRSRALFPLFRRLGRIIKDALWQLQPEPAVEGEGHRMPFGIIIAVGCVLALGANHMGWSVLP
jgi:Flp pilus assembly protein protease CpaA